MYEQSYLKKDFDYSSSIEIINNSFINNKIENILNLFSRGSNFNVDYVQNLTIKNNIFIRNILSKNLITYSNLDKIKNVYLSNNLISRNQYNFDENVKKNVKFVKSNSNCGNSTFYYAYNSYTTYSYQYEDLELILPNSCLLSFETSDNSSTYLNYDYYFKRYRPISLDFYQKLITWYLNIPENNIRINENLFYSNNIDYTLCAFSEYNRPYGNFNFSLSSSFVDKYFKPINFQKNSLVSNEVKAEIFSIHDSYDLNLNWWDTRDLNIISSKIFNLTTFGKQCSFLDLSNSYTNCLNQIPNQYGLLSVGCDTDWIDFRSRCYQVINTNMVDSNTADVVCASIDSNIAKYSTELTSFLNKLNYSSNPNQLICEKEPIYSGCFRLPSSNGRCVGNKLVCDDGWIGEKCDIFVCKSNCSNHGNCVGPNKCDCLPGWNGKFCSFSLCPTYTSCTTCTVDNGCGWCDESKKCFPGNGFNINDNSIAKCKNWFYYTCTTIDNRLDRSQCSSDIRKYDCKKNFCLQSSLTKYDSESCQKCLDYEYCFMNGTNGCKVWSEEKCPNGVSQPDYSNPDRIKMTKLSDDIIYMDDSSSYGTGTTIFKCPCNPIFNSSDPKII